VAFCIKTFFPFPLPLFIPFSRLITLKCTENHSEMQWREFMSFSGKFMKHKMWAVCSRGREPHRHSETKKRACGNAEDQNVLRSHVCTSEIINFRLLPIKLLKFWHLTL
jgi:hypothetical protein